MNHRRFLTFCFLLLFFVFLFVAGCSKSPAGEKGYDADAAKRDEAAMIAKLDQDGYFTFAHTVMYQNAVPNIYSLPLPTSAEDLKSKPPSYPPPGYVKSSVCAGDQAMLEKFLAAVTKAAEKGKIEDDLKGMYGSYFEYCKTTGYCDWIAGQLEKEHPAPVREILWQAFTECRAKRYDSIWEKGNAPAEVVFKHYIEDFEREEVPLTPNVMKAAHEIIKKGDIDDARRMALLLGEVYDDKLFRFIKTLQKEVKDNQRKALIGIGMDDRPEPEAKALLKAACSRPENKDDSRCPGENDIVCDTADCKVKRYGVSLKALLYFHSQKEVSDALKRCIDDSAKVDGSDRVQCLTLLAKMDFATAQGKAKTMDRAKIDSDYDIEIIDSLAGYEGPNGLKDEFARLGLIGPNERAIDEGMPAITPFEVLTKYGRAISFDTETSTFPNRHDQLLKRLSSLTKGDLDGVIFQEIPPPESEYDGGGTPYQLSAFWEGTEYRVAADNNGDWYDVNAVIGLLNSLLKARKSNQRFVSLATGGQAAKVVAGHGMGLSLARKKGLIKVSDADAAMKLGKDAEEKFFKMMDKQKIK